jgi:DNA-binding transcriptional LysR family regulator
VPLFEDKIMAVAAPGFARDRAIASIEDLVGVPFIHVVNESTDWTGWPEWFASFGYQVPTARGILVNNYMTALQLARGGAGWLALDDRDWRVSSQI